MVTEDQSEVIAFLESPSTHGGEVVERIDTHASMVFLAGSRAWKLKRAVRYDYLDFSTAERRKVMCEAEAQINRRTAPALYDGAVPITRESDGSLALGGQGVAVDWVVAMTRFDQAGLFDRLAAAGALDLALMRPLGLAIAQLHRDAERRTDRDGRAAMAWVIDGNNAGFREHERVLDLAACARVTSESRAELARREELLERRSASGFVRQCHGDLHLRNIVLFDGRPTLFDAIEFNDEIAWIDVLYDLAFLLMDLWRRRLPRHANMVFNGYLAEAADMEGIGLLPLFLSCRAGVRAKTSATAAALQTDPRRRAELHDLAREYLGMAVNLLRRPGPCLVAVGGLSGSGKSTLAQTLAPAVGPIPGAVVLRSDEVRKRLCGVSELTHLGQDAYTAEISRQVYEMLAERAKMIIGAGHAAIVDAVYAHPQDRMDIERAAEAASVPFVGLWLDAPEALLIDRVQGRGIDASDADAAVVREQRAQDIGSVTWHRLDAATAMEVVHGQAISHLEHAIRDRMAVPPGAASVGIDAMKSEP